MAAPQKKQNRFEQQVGGASVLISGQSACQTVPDMQTYDAYGLDLIHKQYICIALG